MIPRTGNVMRIGHERTLVRVVKVDLYENISCIGAKPLHRAHALRFDTGESCWFHVTHADAIRRGWVV